MASSFSIDVDPAHNLVRIRIAGFFNHDDIDRLVEDWREARARLYCPFDRHLTLVDTRAGTIHSREVVDHWRDIVADPGFRSRRLAFVTGPTLIRRQVQRASAGAVAQILTDEEEAERWLLADEASAAA